MKTKTKVRGQREGGREGGKEGGAMNGSEFTTDMKGQQRRTTTTF